MTGVLSEKIAIVTGTSRGVGRALAKHLLAQGAQVYGLARGEATLVAPNYRHLQVDISDPAGVQSVFRELGREAGGVDILINNAAVLTSQRSMLLDPGAAQAMINVNLFGTFLVSREASRLMRRRPWGRIVNIGSMAAALQPVGDSVYAATKAAVAVLANVLAKELGPLRITCNTLAISAIASDMLDQLPRERIDEIIAGLPVPRLAEMDDVLNVIDFFLSPRSSYITAQTIWLGGLHR